MPLDSAAAQSTTARPARLAQICAALGAGADLHDVRDDGIRCSATLRTADGGAIELQLDERALCARATGWPEVRHHGLQRRFGRELSARLGAHRDAGHIAQDLRRRVLEPYAIALSEERQRAQRYRTSLRGLAASLHDAGFSTRDLHLVGRNLVLQRPYAALDSCGAPLPSDSTTTIAMHDTTPVVRIELRHLSPAEAGEVHAFVDALLARRRRQLRLCA